MLPISEMVQQIMDGTLADAKTVTGLLMGRKKAGA